VVEQALPGAQPSEGDRGALHVRQVPWLRREHGGNNRAFGGDAVAVEWRQREDVVTLGDVAYVGRDSDDGAGKLVGRDRREPTHRPAELVARYRSRVHADKRLAWAHRRHLDLVRRKAIDPGSVQSHRTHHGLLPRREVVQLVASRRRLCRMAVAGD
jgi:hypothetical protein